MPDPRRIARMERTSRVLAIFVLIVGVVVLAGWATGIPIAQRIASGAPSMKMSTAIGLICVSVGLLASHRRNIATILGVAATTIGALTLLQYATGIPLAIDELLLPDPDRTFGGPVRMSATSAVCLVSSGLAIVGAAWNAIRVTHALAIGTFAGAFVALLGHVFNVSVLYRISAFSSMALHTSIAFVVLAVALLATRPGSGLTAVFANHGAGGLMVRRVLPLAVTLPIASAWLVSAGVDAGAYDPRFATALNICSTVALLMLVILGAAQRMWAIDHERRSAQHELQLLNVELEQQVSERTAALAGSEERFRSISEAAQDAIVIADEVGVITYANRAVADLFGYTRDELLGQPLTILMPDRFRKLHQKGLARFLETEEPTVIGTTVELAGRKKDGSEFPLELSLSTWTSEDRRFFSGYIRNISARKETERARALHATIVTSSDDAIYAVDPSGIVTSWNTGAERLYGYTAEQAIGQTVAIVCPQGRGSEAISKIEQVLRTRSVVREQTDQRTKEGALVPVSVTISPLADSEGAAIGVSVIARDVSEIRRREAELAKSEASYRLLTESVSDMIVRMGTDGTITYVSPSVRRLMGYEPEEVIGLTAIDFIPSENEDEIARVYGEVLAGRPASTQQLVRRKDGTEVWVEATANPVTGIDGTIEGIIWVSRDVSGHVEALARQREIAERHEELNQLKSEFVGIVAHDLKSPMSVIAGFADLLVDHWDTTSEEEKFEFLGRIRQTIRRLSDLVDDVLQVARIESGEMSFNVEPIDLAAVVRETVQDTQESEPERTINVTIPGSLPPVLGDKERQWRILTNLLTNAIKFSDPGEPIDVIVERVRDDVRVSVVDRGAGIYPDDIPRLFQRFARVKQPEGRRVQGTGLGLYICRSLVEAQGGRISVDSKLGEGSTFRYTVPIAGEPI